MNRTAFGAALSRALADAGGAPIAVAVINLDRFRRINEHLGYSVGDAVLIKMAARLAAVPSVESAVAPIAADQIPAFTPLLDAARLQDSGSSLVMGLPRPVFVRTHPLDIN